MKRKLLMVRHAETSTDHGISDFERSLTPEGRRNARYLGRWLYERSLNVDLMFSSSAIRAKMTCEEIADEMNREISDILFTEELYDASVRTLLDYINQFDPKSTINLVVGHNPTMTYLAEYLTGESVGNMEPGSLVEIDFEDISWEEISEKSGKLITLQTSHNR